MLMIDPDTGQIAYANKQAARFYKTPLELLLKKNIKDINQLSSIEVEREIVNAKLTKRNYFLFKHRIGTDEIRDVEVYSYPVKHDGKQMLFSVVVDVTDKLAAEAEVKAYELKHKQDLRFVIYLVLSFSVVISIMAIAIYLKNKKLLFLTNYDALTGVINRRSIIDIYNSFQKKRHFPIAVFMVDVNNLKFINDTFGHIAGDKMIIEVSNMLKSFNKVKTVISRVSGDEFVLMIPGATEEIVTEYVEFINSYQITIEGINFCSSVGVYMVNDRILPYEFAFTKAEKKMYTHKSLNKETLNTNIEKSLMDKATTSIGIKDELKKVAEISGIIAERLGLSSHDVDNIKEATKLQVIGYATHNDESYNFTNYSKDENCSESFQNHPEQGYKILTTLGKNSSVATAVFYHHENYDGSGFPKSIKGEDIPLASRIITLANGIYRAMKADGVDSCDSKILDGLKADSGLIYDPHLIELIDSEEFSISFR